MYIKGSPLDFFWIFFNGSIDGEPWSNLSKGIMINWIGGRLTLTVQLQIKNDPNRAIATLQPVCYHPCHRTVDITT